MEQLWLTRLLRDIGAVLLILALLGLIRRPGVDGDDRPARQERPSWTTPGGFTSGPLNAGKNLVATGKGIAQQETVRVKHVIGTVPSRQSSSVKGSVNLIVKDAVQTVHPEELQPAVTHT